VGRKLSAEDFEKTRSSREGEAINYWGVCADYDLRPTRRLIKDYFDATRQPHEFYVIAKYPLTDSNRWKSYKPFEIPDLFLRFARLAERSRSEQRALEWSREYGVLGLSAEYRHAWIGGERDDIDNFDEQATRAAGILAMYEVTLNQDHDKAKRLVLEKYPSISAELWSTVGSPWEAEATAKIVAQDFVDNYLAYALEASSWLVERTVKEHCHPTLRSEGSPNPSELSGGWGFKSLLGAMYLQMYFLMASGGEVTRCKYCTRIVSLNRPFPDARKPPRHKKFCNNACRQSYYYHRKTKPGRRARRS
jgi:hypothetical protein